MFFYQLEAEFNTTDLGSLTPDELDNLDNRVLGYKPVYHNDDPERSDKCKNMRVVIRAAIISKDPEFYNRRDDERIKAHVKKITSPAFMKRRRDMCEELGIPEYGDI